MAKSCDAGHSDLQPPGITPDTANESQIDLARQTSATCTSSNVQHEQGTRKRKAARIPGITPDASDSNHLQPLRKSVQHQMASTSLTASAAAQHTASTNGATESTDSLLERSEEKGKPSEEQEEDVIHFPPSQVVPLPEAFLDWFRALRDAQE